MALRRPVGAVVSDGVPSLGEQIAKGVVDGQHAAHHAYKDLRHDERKEWLEFLEGEGVNAVQQMIGRQLDCSNLPPEVAQLVGRVCKPEHPAEVGAIAGILIGIGYSLAQATLAGPASQLSIESMRLSGRFAIDPNQLAAGALTQRVGDDWARDEARSSGVSSGQFDAMQLMATQTLSPNQWLDLWRQGKIGDGDIDRVMKRGGLDDESIASLKRLRQGPPGVAFAVDAITQNQIGWEAYENLLEWNGIEKGWAKSMYETSGATMPLDMANRLFREGWIEQPQYEEILTESNLKNKYVPLMANLRFRYPPMEQSLRMYRHNVIDAATAQDFLEKQGFFPDIAKKLVESAATSSTVGTKNLSPSVVERLYEVGKFTRDEATSHLMAMGYDATEADLLLFLTEEAKKHAQMERAATSIGTRYVSWKIDRSEAVTLLDRINVPGPQRDEMLAVWDARREAQTLHLSEAFLHKAFNAQVITAADVRPRLLAMGYDEIDTDIIMRTDFVEKPVKGKSKDLTRADETKRYKAGTITKAQFHDRLMTLGYDSAEADQIIELVDGDIAKAAAKEAATNGA